MTAPLATPATESSSTLYFGPWYRRSPFFEKTLEIEAPHAGLWAARTAAIAFPDPRKDVPKS